MNIEKSGSCGIMWAVDKWERGEDPDKDSVKLRKNLH